MEKKYKHRKSQLTVVRVENNENYTEYYKLDGNLDNTKIPTCIVENSNDWELIEDKPIITHDFSVVTNDGVTITHGYKLVYTVDLHENLRTLTARSVNPWTQELKVFSSREARDKYIESLRSHFLLSVEDGGYITDRTQRVWLAIKIGDTWYGQTCSTNNSLAAHEFADYNAANRGNVKVFRSTFARDQYVKDNNKPQFEFTTEDGLKVTALEYELNTLKVEIWKETSVTPAFMAKDLDKNKWKFFYHRDNLLKYIEEHRPKSKFEFITEDGYRTEDPEEMLYTLSIITWLEISPTSARLAKAIQNSPVPSKMKFFSKLSELEYYRDKFQPKVILTTQDGIDITDPFQRVYIIRPDWKEDFLTASLIGNEYYLKLCKLFSSEAKRDEYIMNTKPLLSLSEVKSALADSHGFYRNSYQARKRREDILEELAKSKL